ncbi:hypothetical protein BDR26DRAFT_861367 [Obelidium mucronatum]|nr:hypothetical protein BDR26DRAFT_861367 [Obelidium mucronatum]
MKGIQQQQARQLNSDSPIVAVVSYCVSSNLMVIANKAIMSTFGFKYAFFVLALQTLLTWILLHICSIAGLLSYRKFNVSDGFKWLPVSISLVLMIYTGATTLQHMSIDLFNVFKNMTLILMAYGEQIFFRGPKVTGLVLLSFGFMIGSAVLAGKDKKNTIFTYVSLGQCQNASPTTNQTDLTVSYFWMFANCVTTALFSLAMKARITGIGFKDFDTVYFNQVLGFPILFVCSLIFEWNAFGDLIQRFNSAATVNGILDSGDGSRLLFAIFMSGITQFGIAYCSAWCLRVTSSTTLSMVGTLNKLPLSIIGMLMFQDSMTAHRLEGAILAVIGGILYSVARKSQYRDKHVLPVASEDHKQMLLSDRIGKVLKEQ